MERIVRHLSEPATTTILEDNIVTQVPARVGAPLSFETLIINTLQQYPVSSPLKNGWSARLLFITIALSVVNDDVPL